MNDLMWTVGAVFSLPIFIFLGALLINGLKTLRASRFSSAERRADPAAKGMMRRKIESNPNIICGFPIHQKAREEAPF
jgi:hypothetical protein